MSWHQFKYKKYFFTCLTALGMCLCVYACMCVCVWLGPVEVEKSHTLYEMFAQTKRQTDTKIWFQLDRSTFVFFVVSGCYGQQKESRIRLYKHMEPALRELNVNISGGLLYDNKDALNLHFLCRAMKHPSVRALVPNPGWSHALVKRVYHYQGHQPD